MSGWDPALLGRRLRPAFDALVNALLDGERDRDRLRERACAAGPITRHTFDELVRELARYGIVNRQGVRHAHLSLTVLGRVWVESQMGVERGAWRCLPGAKPHPEGVVSPARAGAEAKR